MKALILGGAAVLASAAAVLAAGQLTPPPGDYRIDSEATTTTRSGPMVMKSVQRVDGASGATTVEQTAPDGSVAKQAYPGQGPNHWCVKGSGAPPPGVVSNCSTQAFSALPSGGSTYQTACSGGQVLSDNFRKLADGRWERTFRIRQTAAGGGAPVPAQTRAAMAPVIAQIEEAIRSGPPEEREAAKQQLAALKASLGGGAVPGNETVIESREVWTKVSESCG